MSVHDQIKAGMAKVAARLYVPATLTRTIKIKTPAEQAAGRGGIKTVETITGTGMFTTIKVWLEDGTRQIAAGAVLTMKPEINDKLTIGTREETIATVEEVNPTGDATALLYRVTLQ